MLCLSRVSTMDAATVRMDAKTLFFHFIGTFPQSHFSPQGATPRGHVSITLQFRHVDSPVSRSPPLDWPWRTILTETFIERPVDIYTVMSLGLHIIQPSPLGHYADSIHSDDASEGSPQLFHPEICYYVQYSLSQPSPPSATWWQPAEHEVVIESSVELRHIL